MLFIFFLLGVSTGTQMGVLSPVPKDLKNSTLSLIQTARSNPRALVKMLEGAKPETIDEIITILNQLVEEGRAERKRLWDAVVRTSNAMNDASDLVNKRFGERGAAVAVQQATTKAERFAFGVLEEAQREHDDGKPGLDNEIAIFDQVLDILNNLLAGQPQPKQLIALGSTSKGKSYQKLIENVKADPDKLKRIIGLVLKLKTQSVNERDLLVQTLSDAQNDYDLKKKAMDIAVGKRAAAENLLIAARQLFEQARGASEQAESDYDSRNPTLNDEEKTLLEVISLLEGLKK